MFRFFATIFMTAMMFISCMFTISMVQADMVVYRSEGECIRGYIASGVARSDITTHNGQCYIK